MHAHLLPEPLSFPYVACSFVPECTRPFFPEAPILLALVGILHITKLHVVRASVQFSVCDIFTWVHAHGYGCGLKLLQVVFSSGEELVNGEAYTHISILAWIVSQYSGFHVCFFSVWESFITFIFIFLHINYNSA